MAALPELVIPMLGGKHRRNLTGHAASSATWGHLNPMIGIGIVSSLGAMFRSLISMGIFKLGMTSNNNHSHAARKTPKITGAQNLDTKHDSPEVFEKSQGMLAIGSLGDPGTSGCRSFRALAIRAMAGMAKVSKFASVIPTSSTGNGTADHG